MERRQGGRLGGVSCGGSGSGAPHHHARGGVGKGMCADGARRAALGEELSRRAGEVFARTDQVARGARVPRDEVVVGVGGEEPWRRQVRLLARVVKSGKGNWNAGMRFRGRPCAAGTGSGAKGGRWQRRAGAASRGLGLGSTPRRTAAGA